ncbi:uncharacterized protein LOC122693706 [Cervus elaphus]|uniref:uncharacterized protein LOC122693706 n=1 Tax=Cervus elaphus TaxID=9860 RepID=UPI001CC2A381|nr:uncharacterized protein LOC122693706 [Cervus elaphus]
MGEPPAQWQESGSQREGAALVWYGEVVTQAGVGGEGREGSQELSPPRPAGGDGGRQKGLGPEGVQPGGAAAKEAAETLVVRRGRIPGCGGPPGAERLCPGRACPDTGYPVLGSPPKGGPSQVCWAIAEQAGVKDRRGAPTAQAPLFSSPAVRGRASRTRPRAGALRRGARGPDVETEAERAVRASEGFKALRSHRSWIFPLQRHWLGTSPGAFRHPGVRQPASAPPRQKDRESRLLTFPSLWLPQSLHCPPCCPHRSPTPVPSLSMDPRSPCLLRWGNSKGRSLLKVAWWESTFWATWPLPVQGWALPKHSLHALTRCAMQSRARVLLRRLGIPHAKRCWNLPRSAVHSTPATVPLPSGGLEGPHLQLRGHILHPPLGGSPSALLFTPGPTLALLPPQSLGCVCPLCL